MNRRKFLSMAAKGALGGAVATTAGCSLLPSSEPEIPTPAPAEPTVMPAAELTEEVQRDSGLPVVLWQMPTSWPVFLSTIFGGANTFVQRVAAMTGGKFLITPRPAGELVGGLEVLGTVSANQTPIGHTASYYYFGDGSATIFGTAVPFGLNAQQQSSWLYESGGLDLMHQYYADRFNMIAFPAGSTGAQMGGWFRQEVTRVRDLQGLRMRIPGLGGQVMSRLGVETVTLAAGDIADALLSDDINAAEFIGPYDDERLGLNEAASFYYTPGWWEPNATLDIQINLDEWNALPEAYQEIVKTAAFEANTRMLARYDALNNEALQRLIDNGTQLRTFSPEILAAAEEESFALLNELAAADADFNTIFQDWQGFRERIYAWHNINEAGFAEYVYTRFNQDAEADETAALPEPTAEPATATPTAEPTTEPETEAETETTPEPTPTPEG